MTDYRWRDGTPVAAACFENEPGPPGLLALSAADLAAFDAETAALARWPQWRSGRKRPLSSLNRCRAPRAHGPASRSPGPQAPACDPSDAGEWPSETAHRKISAPCGHSEVRSSINMQGPAVWRHAIRPQPLIEEV